ncbi:MAG: RNA ligase family protein [Bacteroidia bacterium]|nr:RNA ligase family protein [Bacteroidia bacterium]
MSPSKKYGRTLHAQISLGTTSDDRFMPDGYVRAFADLDQLVITEKLDGQNNCFNQSGVYARSHLSPTLHPWDKPMRERWELIKNDLGNLEVFGENMFGIHSIEYRRLESYFYVFAIRQGDQWLSWEEVCFYAAMLDFPVVPELTFPIRLDACFVPGLGENQVLEKWLTQNLGMPWEDWVHTPGSLGGFDPKSGKAACEGLVVRNKNGFRENEGPIPVADNEFNQLFKLVRKGHVTTETHWTKIWQPASLLSCDTYKWYGYEYLIR